MPKRDRIVLKSCTVAPKMLRDATRWSPALSRPMQQVKIALIPDDVAMQASAPSSAASRSWNIATVGFEKRE